MPELQAELEVCGACDLVSAEEKRRAVMPAREAASYRVHCLISPFSASKRGSEADETADNYSILMSHFNRQHNIDPRDIRTYLGGGIDDEELC